MVPAIVSALCAEVQNLHDVGMLEAVVACFDSIAVQSVMRYDYRGQARWLGHIRLCPTNF